MAPAVSLQPVLAPVLRDCRRTAGAAADHGLMTRPFITAATSAPTTAGIVDRFLDAVCAGDGVPAELFAADAVLDATVPGWRFSARGADAVAGQYSEWFAASGAFEELDRLAVDGGEVVCYLLTWLERGIPHAAHHCHVLGFAADGRIGRDRFFCGGRWDAGLLAEMAAADDAG